MGSVHRINDRDYHFVSGMVSQVGQLANAIGFIRKIAYEGDGSAEFSFEEIAGLMGVLHDKAEAICGELAERL
jgi:hypothetical protein